MHLNEIKSKLAQFKGTSNYYHLNNKNVVYTDGVKELYTVAQCYWLHEVFETEILKCLTLYKIADTYYFEIRVKDFEGNIFLKDYRGNDLFHKELEFTDFPQGVINLIVGYDLEHVIICLPSED